MRQASDGTGWIPYWKDNGFPQSHQAILRYSAVPLSAMTTTANDKLWLSLELERPNRYLKWEQTLKKSQLKEDLEHIVLMHHSQISHLHSHEAEGGT